METNPFYLVWTPDTGYARIQHRSQFDALEEARRLARLDQDKEFYVLKAQFGITAIKPVYLKEVGF